jgi:hypothetical protein
VNPKKSTVNFLLPPSGDDNEPIQRRSKPKNVVPVDIIKLVQGYDYKKEIKKKTVWKKECDKVKIFRGV